MSEHGTNVLLCSNFCGTEHEKNNEMNLMQKFSTDFEKMQAVRNFKNLGQSENMEYSAKKVKSKKNKPKKAKKMRPLTDENAEQNSEQKENKMLMNSTEKFTLDSAKSGIAAIASKFSSTTKSAPRQAEKTKVQSAQNNNFDKKKDVKKFDKPNLNSVNEQGNYTTGKTPSSKTNKNKGNIMKIRDDNILLDSKATEEDEHNKIKKGKSKSKTKKIKELNDDGELVDPDYENNRKAKSKSRKKSKKKNKDNSNDVENSNKKNKKIPNINNIKDFKASRADATDLFPKAEEVEDFAVNVADSNLKSADVNINMIHKVTKVGGVKKPVTLPSDSLIASSKMNLNKNYYQNTFHFGGGGGLGLDNAYSKISKKKIDVDYDPHTVYGKATGATHQHKTSTGDNNNNSTNGFSNYPTAKDLNKASNPIENDPGNSSGFNYTFKDRESKQNKMNESNARDKSSKGNKSRDRSKDEKNRELKDLENSTDNTMNHYSSKISNKNNSDNKFIDAEFDKNDIIRNRRKLENMFESKEREKERDQSLTKKSNTEDKYYNNTSNNSFKVYAKNAKEYDNPQTYTKQIKTRVANVNPQEEVNKENNKQSPSFKEVRNPRFNNSNLNNFVDDNVNFRQLLSIRDNSNIKKEERSINKNIPVNNTESSKEIIVNKEKKYGKSFTNQVQSTNPTMINKNVYNYEINNQLNTTESSSNNKGVHLFKHTSDSFNNTTGRFILNGKPNKSKQKVKDKKSCELCEKIYKETILHNKQVTLNKCYNCQNEINLDSLEFYMKKYHDDLIKEQKKKLETLIDRNLFSLKEEATINRNNGWIETEKAKNDKIIREKMKLDKLKQMAMPLKVPQIKINL